MDPLAGYLRQAARTPFAWGAHDCSLFVAGWITERTGVDVAAPYRGRYRTALGCARVVRRAGGLEAIFARAAAASGARVVEGAPEPGDWGLIPGVTARGVEPTGAILGPGGLLWLALGPAGLIGGRATALAAWRC